MKKKVIIIFTLLFSQFIWSKFIFASTTTITTMNIAWYGSTHFPPDNDDEREVFLKDFFKTELLDTEIFLFQEITKPEQFQKLLNPKFKCLAYDDRGRAHQYVVTCFNQDKFEAINTDNEMFNADRTLYISEKKDRVRDVLNVSLKSKLSGEIIHTFNLHLKAGYEQTDFRIEQSKKLLSQMKTYNIPLNETILIGGDFNSYYKKVDKSYVNEIDSFLKLSQTKGFNFYTETGLLTTLSSRQKSFDYLLIETPNAVSGYQVFPVCQKTKSSKDPSLDYVFFKNNISDHCPVTSTLKLN